MAVLRELAPIWSQPSDDFRPKKAVRKPRARVSQCVNTLSAAIDPQGRQGARDSLFDAQCDLAVVKPFYAAEREPASNKENFK
jgi:hypothetical protein